jgi:hypothetical protein
VDDLEKAASEVDAPGWPWTHWKGQGRGVVGGPWIPRLPTYSLAPPFKSSETLEEEMKIAEHDTGFLRRTLPPSLGSGRRPRYRTNYLAVDFGGNRTLQ